MVKAVLIDPVAKTVTDVEYDGSLGINEIYKLLNCTTFTVAPMQTSRVSLFVDDEGFLKAGERSFQFAPSSPHFLLGRGLFVGCSSEGETIDYPTGAKEVEELVHFEDQRFVFQDNIGTVKLLRDYPYELSYKTGESGWCFYGRYKQRNEAYQAWTDLETSGVDFDAIRIESS